MDEGLSTPPASGLTSGIGGRPSVLGVAQCLLPQGPAHLGSLLPPPLTLWQGHRPKWSFSHFSAPICLAGETFLGGGRVACLHPREENQAPSELSQRLVLEVMDGEVDAGRASGGPLPGLRSALCLQKPFSRGSGLSASQETVGEPWERPRRRREGDSQPCTSRDTDTRCVALGTPPTTDPCPWC